jgi:hypothetical protein
VHSNDVKYVGSVSIALVGTPRFRPSSLFLNPRDFGRSRWAKPQPTPQLRPGQRAWALYQHRVALAVLEALANQLRRIENLADDLDENPDWLTRKLYGRVPADLGEMYEWCEALGIEAMVAPPALP